jgi:hypothetical protein
LQKGAAEVGKIRSKILRRLNLGQNQIDDDSLKIIIKREDGWPSL